MALAIICFTVTGYEVLPCLAETGPLDNRSPLQPANSDLWMVIPAIKCDSIITTSDLACILPAIWHITEHTTVHILHHYCPVSCIFRHNQWNIIITLTGCWLCGWFVNIWSKMLSRASTFRAGDKMALRTAGPKLSWAIRVAKHVHAHLWQWCLFSRCTEQLLCLVWGSEPHSGEEDRPSSQWPGALSNHGWCEQNALCRVNPQNTAVWQCC